MHHRIIRKNALLAIALLLSANQVLAVGKHSSVMGSAKEMINSPAARAKPAPVPLAKRVDVNSASKAALMKLPGIFEEEADSIIANRPYLTKSSLVTSKALPMGVYQGIRNLVKVRQK